MVYTRLNYSNKSEFKCDNLLSKISEQTNKGSAPPPVEAPANLPDDEEGDIAESPKNSPTNPRKYKEPSPAPQAHSPNVAC